MLSLGLALGASAQRGGGHSIAHGGGFYHGSVGYAYPRTYVGVGLGWGWGYPYGFYGPWGPWGPWGYGAMYAPYPPYYYGYGTMPPQLAGEVQGIKDDYAQQIKDVRHDKALAHKEKRTKIDQLKKDRDDAVVKARHDFFFNSRRNYQPSPNNNNQQPKSGNGSSSNDGPEYQDHRSGNLMTPSSAGK